MGNPFKHIVDVIANVGTGGLYGVGQGLAEGRPLQALSSYGTFGEVTQPTLGTGAALSGELAGAGAGIGGAAFGAPLAGANIGNQLGQLGSQFFGAGQVAPNQMGTYAPGGTSGPQSQGLQPTQLAALTAQQSQRGPGSLDPAFLALMKQGQSPQGGLSNPTDLSGGGIG